LFLPSVLKQCNKYLDIVGNNCSSQNYANHYLTCQCGAGYQQEIGYAFIIAQKKLFDGLVRNLLKRF